MHSFPNASSVAMLTDRAAESDFCDDLTTEQAERIVDLAQRRVHADSALEQHDTTCVLMTDWVSFAASEFGYDNDEMNTTAVGTYNHSASSGKNADKFDDVTVIQQGWLTTGDGRKTQMVEYVDDDFDKASPGEMWVPHGAQEYMCIVALDSTLVHDNPSVAEAM